MYPSIALAALLASIAAGCAISNPQPYPRSEVLSTELYTVETAPGQTRQVTGDEKWALVKGNVRFLDVTGHADVETAANRTLVTYPTDMKQQSTVTALFPRFDKDLMKSKLKTFSGFYNRFFDNENGVKSSAWLLKEVQAVIKASGADKAGATAAPFKHDWLQSSIIARVPGRSSKLVVVGAHQDSINHEDDGEAPDTRRAPGADDNGSGTVTILEAMRVLLSDPTFAQGKGENTLEFHWYSGEENGLLGSQDIFNNYSASHVDVRAMLNQDMTGFAGGKGTAPFGVVTDFVDSSLTSFVQNVIDEYCSIPFVETTCGYACSDHASAKRAGYPSAFVSEAPHDVKNEAIHTEKDVISNLSFDHMVEHAKLVVGYMYELGMTQGL